MENTMMDVLVVELLKEKLEEEINQVLKQLQLKVDQMELNQKENLSLVIKLKSAL